MTDECIQFVNVGLLGSRLLY